MHREKHDTNKIKIYKIIGPLITLFLIFSFVYITLIAAFKPQTFGQAINGDKKAQTELNPINLVKTKYIQNTELKSTKTTVNIILATIIVIYAVNYLRKRMKKDNDLNNKTI